MALNKNRITIIIDDQDDEALKNIGRIIASFLNEKAGFPLEQFDVTLTKIVPKTLDVIEGGELMIHSSI